MTAAKINNNNSQLLTALVVVWFPAVHDLWTANRGRICQTC